MHVIHFPRRDRLPALLLLTAIAGAISPPMALGKDIRAGAVPGYNMQFLQGAAASTDLEAFLRGEGVLPGTYRVDVFVNRGPAGRHTVNFFRNATVDKVLPCLGLPQLQVFGVDTEQLRKRAAASGINAADKCLDLAKLVPEYRAEYQASQLRLLLSFPQASMRPLAKSRVDPAQWEEGTAAAFTSYSLLTSRSWNEGVSASGSSFVGLRNGVNVGRWRIRNDSTLSHSGYDGTRFRSNRTFVQRDIDGLHSQFTAGQTFTNSDIFDSVRIRGVELRTDESMLPEDARGYAPVVRGFAETNATIEIRQNGYLLVTAPVTPGPFVIDDLRPSGSNGELEITVVEADGRRRTSRQPFGALPVMVRAGALRYSAALGSYDDGGTRSYAPLVAVGTVAWGLNDDLTTYGGMQASAGFHALNIGAGTNTRFGALSADLTHSDSAGRVLRSTGQSLRLLYNKTFSLTATNFTLAGYRYSSEGYRTLQDHFYDRESGVGRDRDLGRTRTSFNLSIHQKLGERLGSIYVSANDQTYWGASGRRRGLQTGYNNNFGRIYYSLSVSYTNDMLTYDRANRSGRVGSDTRAMLTLSTPLGDDTHAPSLQLGMTGGRGTTESTSTGMSGTLPGEHRLAYSLYGTRDAGRGNSASASLNAELPNASLGGSYSQGGGYRNATLSASGAAVVHAGGVNFSSYVGETFGIVHVSDTKNIGVMGGGTTDANGYGIVPYLSPYARNVVDIDARQAGSDVEVEQTSQQVVPRRGAISLLEFKGSTGRRVQIEVITQSGVAVPLGASIEDAAGRQIGVTDTRGRAMLLLQDDAGALHAKWGKNDCVADYRLPERDASRSFQRIKLTCHIQSASRLQAARGP